MNLYCAFICERRENWQAMMPPLKKPGNVGEKKWLEEGLPAKWLELEAEAQLHLTAGRISRVVAVDDTKAVYDGNADGFVDFLRREVVTSVTLFSFDAVDRMRQLLWTVATDGTTTPFWLWTGSTENNYTANESKFAGMNMPKLRLVDLESLSGSKGEKIPWNQWVRIWGINPETAGDTWQPIHTAEVARGLARRMGFGNASK